LKNLHHIAEITNLEQEALSLAELLIQVKRLKAKLRAPAQRDSLSMMRQKEFHQTWLCVRVIEDQRKVKRNELNCRQS